MIMKYTTILLSLLAFLSFAGCEDLEDTYDEYAGDGPITYLAKCTDVTVESGWQRLAVKWTNKLDPNRNGVWLHCESNSLQVDTLLPADCDSCSVNGLPEGSYTVTVAAVSERGDTALPAISSGRPYTENHEAVLSFTRAITKYIFAGNNLMVFVGMKTPEIVDFKIEYTQATDGQPGEYDLSGNMWAYQARNLFIEDVDREQPVTVTRRGLISGCTDTITFPDFTLDPEVINMQADFNALMLERYGEIDLTREELELDYDLTSMEDILHFPNLKKLVLGKNRYYNAANPNNTASVLLGDWSVQEQMMDYIRKMKSISPDFEIENYGGHYGIWFYTFMGDGITVTDNGLQTTLPADLTLLDTEGFTVTVDDKDGAVLLDNDPATYWLSSFTSSQNSHEVVIDMQEARTLKGVKFTQAFFSGYIPPLQSFAPTAASVEISADGTTWTNPCHSSNLTLGPVNGETKLIDFAQEQTARYIRVTVQDALYSGDYGAIVGDIIPY